MVINHLLTGMILQVGILRVPQEHPPPLGHPGTLKNPIKSSEASLCLGNKAAQLEVAHGWRQIFRAILLGEFRSVKIENYKMNHQYHRS